MRLIVYRCHRSIQRSTRGLLFQCDGSFRRQDCQHLPSASLVTRFQRVHFGSSSNDNKKTKPSVDKAAEDDTEKRTEEDAGLTSLPKETARSVGILTGAMFFNNLGFGCVVPVLPLFCTSMGLGASGVGTILSTAALSRLLMNLPSGRAADTYGRKPLMVGGGATVAVSSLATGLAGSLPQLLACRLAVGCGGSMASAGTGAYLADITATIPHQRARIAGIQSTVAAVAFSVGPAVGGYLCDLYGARNMFFVVGAANAVCTLGYGLLPESRNLESGGASFSDENAKKDPDATDSQSAWVVYRELLKDPDRQGLMAMSFGTFCSYAAMLTVFPLHAAEVLGEASSASAIGTLFAVSSVVGFAGAPLGGYLADTLGRKTAVVPAALLMCAGALLTAGVTPDNASMVTLLPPMLVWGLGNSAVNPGLSAFAADIARDEKTRSQALALSNSASDLSFLVCPISLGALAQATDCPTALAATAGVIGMLSLGFALRTTEPRRMKPPTDGKES